MEEGRIDALIATAERQPGDLDEPGNGALVTVPFGRTKGILGRR